MSTHNTNRDEGVIKFRLDWTAKPPLPKAEISNLNKCRSRLYSKNLIGVYPDGIGFGNLSFKSQLDSSFIITGTQTGHIPELNNNHYTKVTHCDIKQNHITCEGPIKASSESMTHFMIYELNSSIQSVIHVHSHMYWKRLLNKIPTTGRNIPYGTPEMAKEVGRLSSDTDLDSKKCFVMAGHEDGIVAFGSSIDHAEKNLMNCLAINDAYLD